MRPNDTGSVRWNWIHGVSTDLFWYIGSASLGWLYVALVLIFGRGLDDPLRDPFYELELGGATVTMTLGLVVVASWAFLVDAPHVWATLARTWLDPDEWASRRRVLLTSLAFFAVGPVAVFGPYLVGTVVPLSAATMALGSSLFFVFFRLWAYYHVVRQHWGFLVLYKRRNGDWEDPLENRVDGWFFNASLYLPLLVFVTAPWYEATGMPELGLRTPIVGAHSLGSVLHPVALAAYPLTILGFVGFQMFQYRRGHPRNGPKLLLLLAIVPLHLVVFVHPLLALFVVPIVTVGHNLQYHRIVWSFGRNKYGDAPDARFRFARTAFRSVPVYFGFGLLFTFGFYQGPWIASVKDGLAYAFDAWIFRGVGMVAGVVSPESAGVGAQVAATLFLGWAMQHYYLDSKIWRIRRDPTLEKNLY